MPARPNYQGKGIVNLMSSISNTLGHDNPYPLLNSDSSLDLVDSENIVLLIVDGLGFNYLRDKGSNTLMLKHLKDELTSVFLPSTGSAISTFFTGLAPQQHAITGWYVHLPEYGIVTRILPFTTVLDWNVLGTDISNVIDAKPISSHGEMKQFIVVGEEIVDSVYTKYMTPDAIGLGYSEMDDFFEQIQRAIDSSRKSFVHAYWPQFDSVAHILGVESPEANESFQSFDNALQRFVEAIEGTRTKLLITADHGFNDVPSENTIYTNEHPKLMECLTLPLCGDTRTAFCYVRPARIHDFEKYIANNLHDACTLKKSQELVNDGWFGLFDPSPRLLGRVGDYTLLLNDNHAIVNSFPGFGPLVMKGHHGGLTDEEMMVPLITIDC